MKCPKCKSGDNFADNVYNGPNSIRRDRTCKACGHVWRTLEVAAELVPEERTKPCEECGTPVVSKGGRKRFCEECRVKRIKEQTRKSNQKNNKWKPEKEKRVSRIDEINALAKKHGLSYGKMQAKIMMGEIVIG